MVPFLINAQKNCMIFFGDQKKRVQVTSAINGSGLRHVLTEVLKYAKTGASAASESTNQLAEALAKLHPEMTQEKIL